MTKSLQPIDEIARHLLGCEAVKVIGAEVSIVDVIAQHMVRDPQERMADGDDGALLPARVDQASIFTAV